MWLVAKTKPNVAWHVPKKQHIKRRIQIWLSMRIQKASVVLHDNFIEHVCTFELAYKFRQIQEQCQAKKGCDENSLFCRKIDEHTQNI